MILVSACLTGECCKYNGKSNYSDEIATYLSNTSEEVMSICPEQMGGLPTPRAKAEIEGGKSGEDVLRHQARVISEYGDDITSAFIDGADKVIKQIKKKNISKAVLKSKSPSCGCGYIYDGTFSGKLIPGNGVLAAILIQNGIKVMSDDQFLLVDMLED